MQHRLVLNWSKAHEALKQAAKNEIKDPALIPLTGKGWTYVTFSPIGTRPSLFLFDVERIRALARENDFTLPHEVVIQHNKIVITAYSEDGRQSTQLFCLHRLIEAYGRRYGDSTENPHHSFYGKFGGIYDRPEKGRIWAIYSKDDQALLEILQSVERLAAENQMNGVRLDVGLSNGLSALPRMLHGYDDPEYQRSGARHYKITDPIKFHVLLDQALIDYARYQFE